MRWVRWMAAAAILASAWLLFDRTDGSRPNHSYDGHKQSATRSQQRVSSFAALRASTRGKAEGAEGKPSAPPTPVDLSKAPTSGERKQLAEEYVEWRSHPLDRETSRIAREQVETLLAGKDIDPMDVRIACTTSICRGQLGFPTLEEMMALGRIQRSDDVKIGLPEPLENGVTVVFYWKVDE